MPYSTRFVAVNEDLSSGPVLYTVPELYVAIVRDAAMRNHSGTTSTIQVGVTVPGPLNVLIMQTDALVTGDLTEWQGRQVLEAGDELFVYCSGGLCQALVSGYLLSSS